MVVELKLSKSGDRKFGFRLVGGADFEIPLTVSLVGDGSIAEESGMLPGDVVVRINQTPVTSLSHQEAHEVLSTAGSDITVCVLREKDLTPLGPSPAPTVSSPVECAEEFRFDPAFVRDASTISDEQIADLMSGEAEVLREHNIIGVDFNKLMPQVGVFKNSEVFQTLQHEARKTKEDIEAEEKRWTTFLQKPDRPIPKKLDSKPKNTYKPKIVKQPKPLVAPDNPEQIRSPSPMSQYPVHLPLARNTATPEPHYLESKTPSRANTPVPEIMVDGVEPSPEPLDFSPKIEEAKKEEVENSEDQEEFAKQLAGVQQQLIALQNLPNTIQATLDAITSQLTILLNPPKVEEKKVEIVEPPKEEEPEPEPLPMPGPEPPMNEEEEKYDIPEPPDAEHVGPHTEEELEIVEKELERHEEDWQAKQEKEPVTIQLTGDVKADLQAELKQKLKAPKRRLSESARVFGPLTPQERPIFLKGRIWKSPKDAFNEDFIAETISSQAELITGTTLGPAYESPNLGYDKRSQSGIFIGPLGLFQKRLTDLLMPDFPLISSILRSSVNFLKYQKPERDLSFIKNSSVYKLIHGLESTPCQGIERRPEKVAAADDIARCATPCT